MAWWAVLYCAALAGIYLASTVRDVRTGGWNQWLVIDLATMLAWVFLMISYYHPSLAAPFGIWIGGVYAVTLVGTAASTQHDFATIESDPKLSQRANIVAEVVASVLWAVFLTPAAAVGLLVAIRALS